MDATTTTTAAKKKPAAAAKKPAARKRAARRKQQTVKAPAPANKTLPKTVVEQADLGLRLAGLVSGQNTVGESGEAMDMGAPTRSGGLTLDEISMLLQQREARGYHQGHSEAYREARRNIGLRLQRERAEAVAGTLLFVVQQLEPVLHELAARNAPERHANGRAQLVQLCAEFGRASARFAGDDIDGQEIRA